MRGNICSYELDAPGIGDMVQSNLMLMLNKTFPRGLKEETG